MANENSSKPDFENCFKCGAGYFHVVPGKTTKADIKKFLATVPWGAEVEDDWLHPGSYCPNGCEGTGFRANYGIDLPPEISEKEYDLILHKSGDNAGKIILYFKNKLNLTTAEARDFIKKYPMPFTVMSGSLWKLQCVRDELVALGAKVEILDEPDQSTFDEVISKMLNSYYK
jgi:hypothetical protein